MRGKNFWRLSFYRVLNSSAICSKEKLAHLTHAHSVGWKGNLLVRIQNLMMMYTAVRERLSEKVHATIPKGIVGGF